MKKLLILFLFQCVLQTQAQFNPAWGGKKCAVVLTYDDALDVHLDNAIPLLDSLNLRGTFYLTAYADASKKRAGDWKKAADKGHELGNHTLFHPCAGGPGREWLQPEYDMNKYTVRRMEDEIRMTNVFLENIDHKKKRTFAFTCGDMKIGDSSFINGMKADFAAARAVRHEMHKIHEVDLYNVDCYGVNGETGEQMIQWVKKAVETNSLLVILFHGVGGAHSLNVSLEAHRTLLTYLKQNEKDIYIAPMVTVAEHIADWQNRDKQAKMIQKGTDEDHRDMMRQLNIKTLRPGANGWDANAPNKVNYDESKANPYPNLPDPLLLKNGKKVTNADTWWKKRRPEIVEDFDREILGRVPKNVPAVNWKVLNTQRSNVGGIPVVVKTLSGKADNSAYPSITVDIYLQVTIPVETKGPAPVVLEFGWVPPVSPRDSTARFTPPNPIANAWKQITLEKGWGYAMLIPTTVQADNGAGLTEGIIGLTNKGARRKPEHWGALRAWAWGASRAMDYFEKDSMINAKKVAIYGHSRYGKAALVTMAYDTRFASGFISSSGEGGAKLHRRNKGEIVENLTGSGEYHWMAGNFIKYGGPLQWNDLPVDAHELIALSAPRPLFISGGDKGDEWIDVRGMFMATVAAEPVYKLLGKKGVGTAEFPAIETGLMDGDLSFRQHSAGHTPVPNWPVFLSFTERYFGSNTLPIKKIDPVKGLKDYYKDYFAMGVAVSPRSLKTDESQLVLQQYNSMTPENAMKMGPIHPFENEYFWDHADSIAAFAKRHQLKLRGHALVWHNQTPAWLFTENGQPVSKEVLLKRIKDHITTVVKRYKGTIYAWDVVNEAISDAPGEFYRNSLFYKICGEEFIAKAFQWAHEADPDALLFYNDYNEIDPIKREKMFKLVKDLKAAGIPIHGVGLQAHWAINEPTEAQLDSTLKRFGELGLNVQITELDVSVYPKEHNARNRQSQDNNQDFTPDRERQQVAAYDMYFRLFRKYKTIISAITFWNISDRYSWLDNFPVRGRKDYPLLFDKDLKPKKAFWAVVKMQ